MGFDDHLNCLQCFEKASKEYKDEPCLQEGDRILTYGQFQERVQETARWMYHRNDKDTVVINMPQGIEAYTVILGAMMAGKNYVPLPQHLPKTRREAILDALPPWYMVMDAPQEFEALFLPEISSLPGHLPAYTLFTSGSTGVPKGVTLRRKTIDQFMRWAIPTYNVGPGDRWGQFCRLNFDLSIIDLFTALGSGACLVVTQDMLSQMKPARTIGKFGLTVWHSVPSLVDLMIRENQNRSVDLSSLKVASFAGETLKKHQLAFLFEKNPDLRVINSYGTTEGGLNATWIEVNAENYVEYLEEGGLALGKEIPGWGVLLDGIREGTEGPTLSTGPFEPDPVNSNVGEIVIYGDLIAPGYLKTESEAFSKLDFTGTPIPTFSTGDLGLVRDGVLYFRGRLDNQVKLRGNRIELNEIEYWVTESCGYPSAVILFEDALFAFVEVGMNGQGEVGGEAEIVWDEEEIRNKLAAQLEKIKLPKAIFPLRAFPRNSNMKVDRKQLLKRLEKGLNDEYWGDTGNL